MVDRLKLTKNAQFYLAKKDIDNSNISVIIEAAVENVVLDSDYALDIFRQKRTTLDGAEYIFSARVFVSARPVYFFDEEIFDEIYGFIVLIEFEKHLAVFRKSCANLNEAFEESFDLVDGARLASIFDDDLVEYQKISLRNMTISDRAMRGRSYEAFDLKGLFSTHAAGRSIPYFFKIRHDGLLKSFSANTGRMAEASERQSIDEIAAWACSQISSIQNPSANKPFLEAFAKMVRLDDVLKITAPSAVLIESGVISDKVTTGKLSFYRIKNKKIIALSNRLLKSVLSAMEAVYNIDTKLNLVGAGPGARVRQNAKSLTLHSKILQKIKVNEAGRHSSLQKYIIGNGLYSICFNNPKYMYFLGQCFEDSSGISEIDSILDILIPQPNFVGLLSEKGSVTNLSTAFDTTSVFSAVEAIHIGDDYLFCDDLGNEWADHVSMNSKESSITFVHSKHGSSSVAAGKMHEVVAQGIKNIGNMFFSEKQINKKIADKFVNDYKLDGVQTLISRTRCGNTANFSAFITPLLADFRVHRKCILACSFLSKAEVEAEFLKIKTGVPVLGHVVQLLWIISSFAHAAKEANVIPLIYCMD